VLDLVGLHDAARRKVRGYSMGMRQRLGLAATLLGNPRILVLDEPSNGLDPEGIRWLRGFFRHLAGEGRTVLVSSHLLNEVQEFADRVVILNRGQLVRQGSIAELTAGTDTVVVRSPQPAALVEALRDRPDASRPTRPADGAGARHRDGRGGPPRIRRRRRTARAEYREVRPRGALLHSHRGRLRGPDDAATATASRLSAQGGAPWSG